MTSVYLRALTLPLLLSPAAFAQSPLPHDWLEGALRTHLAEFARSAANPAKNVTTRDLTNAALLNLMTAGDPARSEAWIERAYSTQDMDPASQTFGELKWNTADAAITDRNAIEFGTQAIGPLYLTYAGKLSAGFQKRMAPHLSAALAGLHGHKVPVSYTNIFLMNLTSGLLIGQALHDEASVRQAEQELDAWLDYTRRNGIHEFDSPTYTAADLDSLVEGDRYAARPEDRHKFEQALDFFWTDIAASFMPSAHRLVGPYSRDYDFLRGRGGMDVWLTDAGWTSLPSKSLDFEKVYVLENARAGGYRPKPEAAALTEKLPREVLSSWDDNPHHQRFLWVGRNVSLGCTSGDYNAQDKLFNATFSGSADLPQVTIVPDVFDAPYGLVKNPDRTGHMKPTHLPLHAACVESGGVALFTMDLDPSAVPADAKGFATNILLPSEATIAADGPVVTVSLGEAAIALRIFHVDDLPEGKFEISLDRQTGAKEHAARLKIEHLREGQRTQSKHLRIALVAVARDSASADQLEQFIRQAKVSSEVHGGEWTVKAAAAGTSLELVRPANDRKTIASQSVNQKPAPAALLAVDGRDLTAALGR